MRQTTILLSIILVFFTISLVVALPERKVSEKSLPIISNTSTPTIPATLPFYKIGDNVSDIELTDFDGNKTKLSQFGGKPTFIDFWASGCPFCVVEMPAIEKLYQEYKNQIYFIGINRLKFPGETRTKAIQFTKSQVGVSYPLYVDENDLLYQAFGENLNAMPLAIWVSRDMKVIDKKFGPKTNAEMRLTLQKLLQ